MPKVAIAVVFLLLLIASSGCLSHKFGVSVTNRTDATIDGRILVVKTGGPTEGYDADARRTTVDDSFQLAPGESAKWSAGKAERNYEFNVTLANGTSIFRAFRTYAQHGPPGIEFLLLPDRIEEANWGR